MVEGRPSAPLELVSLAVGSVSLAFTGNNRTRSSAEASSRMAVRGSDLSARRTRRMSLFLSRVPAGRSRVTTTHLTPSSILLLSPSPYTNQTNTPPATHHPPH